LKNWRTGARAKWLALPPRQKALWIAAAVVLAAAAATAAVLLIRSGRQTEEPAVVAAAAYDIVQTARETLKAAPAAEHQVRSFVLLTHGEDQRSVTEDGEVRRQGTGADLTLEADVTLDYSGSESRQKIYYAGGFLYRDYRGQKLRTPATDAEAYRALRMPESAFARDAVTRDSVVDLPDGGKWVTLVLDAAAIREFLAERIAPWVSDADLADAEIFYGNARFEMYLDADGVPTSEELRFDASVLLADDEEVDLLVSLMQTLERTDGVTAALPGDLSDYIDTTFNS
jgi:hypothetical protein